MPQFLVSIHRPADYEPSRVEDDAMRREIDILNEEMVAAGVRRFVGGLHPISSAKSLQREPDGQVILRDGPYLKSWEHVGGFWVLETKSLEDALEWGRKAVVACRASVEVRAFH